MKKRNQFYELAQYRIKHWDSSLTLPELAEKFGVEYGAIWNFAYRNNLKFVARTTSKEQWYVDRWDPALTSVQLAKKFKVSVEHLRQIRHRYGLEYKKTPKLSDEEIKRRNKLATLRWRANNRKRFQKTQKEWWDKVGRKRGRELHRERMKNPEYRKKVNAVYRAWYKKNIEYMREMDRQRQNDPKRQAWLKKYTKKQVEELTDNYVRSKLCQDTGLRKADLPAVLIECERARIKLSRRINPSKHKTKRRKRQ